MQEDEKQLHVLEHEAQGASKGPRPHVCWDRGSAVNWTQLPPALPCSAGTITGGTTTWMKIDGYMG